MLFGIRIERAGDGYIVTPLYKMARGKVVRGYANQEVGDVLSEVLSHVLGILRMRGELPQEVENV